MLIFAGLAVFLTGGELVCLLPKLWEKMKVSGRVLVGEYGFSREGQGDCIYSSKLSSATVGYDNTVGCPVKELEASQAHFWPPSANACLAALAWADTLFGLTWTFHTWFSTNAKKNRLKQLECGHYARDGVDTKRRHCRMFMKTLTF